MKKIFNAVLMIAFVSILALGMFGCSNPVTEPPVPEPGFETVQGMLLELDGLDINISVDVARTVETAEPEEDYFLGAINFVFVEKAEVDDGEGYINLIYIYFDGLQSEEADGIITPDEFTGITAEYYFENEYLFIEEFPVTTENLGGGVWGLTLDINSVWSEAGEFLKEFGLDLTQADVRLRLRTAEAVSWTPSDPLED